MAVPRSNSDRQRNILIVGVVIGIILTLIISALFSDNAVSKQDIEDINVRLDSIEGKLSTPPPTPAAATTSPDPSQVSITDINKEPSIQIDKVVTVTGRVTNPYQGVGFILTAPDGTFLWVHSSAKIPTGTATVRGKVTELKDQLATWKTEQGWPEDDSSLTAKLRDEKVFVEAESVT